MSKVICEVCKAERKRITVLHVKMHGFKNIEEYRQKYPDAQISINLSSEARRKKRVLQVQNPVKDAQIQNDFHIHKGRTKKRISYNDYLSLISNGLTLAEIKKQGYSKHQVDFYSALSQNKIGITREQFDEEYKSGRSLDEISEKYNISRDRITQLRDYFGIKRRGPKYINRKKTEKPLTIRQKKIVYGTLMGDGSKMSRSSVKMKHSLKQRYYELWKYSETIEHVSPHSLQIISQFDERSQNMQYALRFYTNANTDIENIVNKFYPVQKKVITDDILDNLDELSLAVWFMDDGVTDWFTRSVYNTRTTCSFCTDSFSHEELNLICLALDELFYLECEIKPRGKNKEGVMKYRIRLNADNTQKLFHLIEPFMIPTMRYKIDLEAYKKWRKEQDARLEMSKSDPIKLLVSEVNDIADYIIENHDEEVNHVGILVNPNICQHIGMNDTAYRFMKD